MLDTALRLPRTSRRILAMAALLAAAPLSLGSLQDPPPPNDECAAAIPITPGVTLADTTAATESPGDVVSCHPGPVFGSLWYTFTATAATARLRTCGSAEPADDSVLAVFAGPCGALTEVGCSDDACGDNGLRADLVVTGLALGSQYHVLLAAAWDTQRGIYPLELSMPAAVDPPPLNDEAAAAMPIVGTGIFEFDATSATPSPRADQGAHCFPNGGAGGIADAWYCWIPAASGTVTISTVDLTSLDTVIAVYSGCGASAGLVPLACSDDTPGPSPSLQSTVTCPVGCGQPLTVRIGIRGGGPPLTRGHFELFAHGGVPCPNAPPVEVCCCGKPRLTAPEYSTFSGTVALATYRPQAMEPETQFVLTLYDLANYQTNLPYAAPIHAAINPAPGVPGGPAWPGYSPYYTPPAGLYAAMGDIFGVAVDPDGNIFLSQLSPYGGGSVTGSLAAGLHGTIYQIDAVTGLGYKYIQLPNTSSSAATATKKAWPELGNICWDCGHNQLFASNFDDGRIYRIKTKTLGPTAGHAGVVVGSFDHATGAIRAGALAGFPEPGDAPGMAPRGHRVFAVRAYEGRLYYSVWAQGLVADPHSIRSIGLTAQGQFIGASKLEVLLPPRTGKYGSAPVADISFSPSGRMLVGERSAQDNIGFVGLDPHVREYERDSAGAWVPSAHTFTINAPADGAAYVNVARGGVDYDWAPGGRVWYVGGPIRGPLDAMGYYSYYIHGIQGAPVTGGDNLSSICLDDDGAPDAYKDVLTSSVRITCPPCAAVTNLQAFCSPPGGYRLTFDIKNLTQTTMGHIFIFGHQGKALSPGHLGLVPALLPGETSTGNEVRVLTTDPPGSTECFRVLAYDDELIGFCAFDLCVRLPSPCVGNEVLAPPSSLGSRLQHPGGIGDMVVIDHLTSGTAPFLFRWRRNGVELSDGPRRTGAWTSTLAIHPVEPSDEGSYDVVVTNCCGTTTSTPVIVGQFCHTDLDYDHTIDPSDMAVFINLWLYSATHPGDLRGDFNGNGSIEPGDVAMFITAWLNDLAAGC